MTLPYAVVDAEPKGAGEHICPGTRLPVLRRFATEREASEFIETLPEYLPGRYGIDGPA
jgi:hypothetical protein